GKGRCASLLLPFVLIAAKHVDGFKLQAFGRVAGYQIDAAPVAGDPLDVKRYLLRIHDVDHLDQLPEIQFRVPRALILYEIKKGVEEFKVPDRSLGVFRLFQQPEPVDHRVDQLLKRHAAYRCNGGFDPLRCRGELWLTARLELLTQRSVRPAPVSRPA